MSPAAAPRRWLVAFGRFWWKFLLGDTPELFVGVIVAVGAVALLAHAGAAHRGVVRVLTVGASAGAGDRRAGRIAAPGAAIGAPTGRGRTELRTPSTPRTAAAT